MAICTHIIGRTKAYWQKKHAIIPKLITRINWDACEVAHSKLPFGKKQWLLKHATGFCAVGKMERQCAHQAHDECPHCQQLGEDVEHVHQRASYSTCDFVTKHILGIDISIPGIT